jgi:Asp-tRNA(Asn)/Glu-tRNA(Gln) amidotransferase A subunit family amidase
MRLFFFKRTLKALVMNALKSLIWSILFQGLPVGLTFMGMRWSEPTLIKFAYAFEQKTKVRKPPEFIPSLNW